MTVFPFVCNAKRFAIAFFFLFLLLVSVFGWTAERFLKKVLRVVSEEECDQEVTHSLDTQ